MADSQNLTPPTMSPSEIFSHECGSASEIGAGVGGNCGGGVSALCASCLCESTSGVSSASGLLESFRRRLRRSSSTSEGETERGRLVSPRSSDPRGTPRRRAVTPMTAPLLVLLLLSDDAWKKNHPRHDGTSARTGSHDVRRPRDPPVAS
jgi:hypothetical protein